MRILVVGGTGFIGPEVVRHLLTAGHEVTLFHRGKTTDERTAGAAEILGDRWDLAGAAARFRRLRPDVVLDMICYNRRDAEGLVDVMAGLAGRAVVLSSMDVYLAYGRLHRTEPGPPQPVPLTESAELRSTDRPTGPERDKRAVRADRLFNYLKPMDDGRDVILLEWIRRIGRAAEWSGQIVVVSVAECPPHLCSDAWLEQDWLVDSSKIRHDLGYREVVDQHQALRRAVEWERAHPLADYDPADFDYDAEDVFLNTTL